MMEVARWPIDDLFWNTQESTAAVLSSEAVVLAASPKTLWQIVGQRRSCETLVELSPHESAPVQCDRLIG